MSSNYKFVYQLYEQIYPAVQKLYFTNYKEWRSDKR